MQHSLTLDLKPTHTLEVSLRSATGASLDIKPLPEAMALHLAPFYMGPRGPKGDQGEDGMLAAGVEQIAVAEVEELRVDMDALVLANLNI